MKIRPNSQNDCRHRKTPGVAWVRRGKLCPVYRLLARRLLECEVKESLELVGEEVFIMVDVFLQDTTHQLLNNRDDRTALPAKENNNSS